MLIMKLKSAFIALSMFMIVGVFLSKNAHAECEKDKQVFTTTGSIFTCDTSRDELNEAWRDSHSVIWGDIVKKTDGTVHEMSSYDAADYCASIGARLPSDSDFVRLREYMGARGEPGHPSRGYSPQILPNLSGYRFWSSSPRDGPEGTIIYFDGSTSSFDFHFPSLKHAVRCIAWPRW